MLTSRLKSNAKLYAPKPERTGRRGRPAKKGDRLPRLARIAYDHATSWQQTEVTRGARHQTVLCHAFQALRYDTWGERPVQVVLVRDPKRTSGYDIAITTMNMRASAAQIIEIYDERWSIEVAIEDAKQITGAGQARNRVQKAVERTVPFGLLCQSLRSAGMRWTATPNRTSPTAASAPAGTPTNATPPTTTCSHACAAKRSPRNICQLPAGPSTHHKSASPRQQSTPPPDNRETRDLRVLFESPTALGSTMAGTAEELAGDPEFAAAAVTALASDLLNAIDS